MSRHPLKQRKHNHKKYLHLQIEVRLGLQAQHCLYEIGISVCGTCACAENKNMKCTQQPGALRTLGILLEMCHAPEVFEEKCILNPKPESLVGSKREQGEQVK